MVQKRWRAHTNAICDLVAWNHADNDNSLITTSGDQSIGLWKLDRLDTPVHLKITRLRMPFLTTKAAASTSYNKARLTLDQLSFFNFEEQFQ
jgi:hypothetical protein